MKNPSESSSGKAPPATPAPPRFCVVGIVSLVSESGCFDGENEATAARRPSPRPPRAISKACCIIESTELDDDDEEKDDEEDAPLSPAPPSHPRSVSSLFRFSISRNNFLFVLLPVEASLGSREDVGDSVICGDSNDDDGVFFG